MTVSQHLSATADAISSFLVGIAVVGKSNEPLYLCDCQQHSIELLKDKSIHILDGVNNALTDRHVGEDNDPFGFTQFYTQNLEQRNSMPLSGQILIHAALDNLEEKIDRPTGKNGQMPIIRNRNSNINDLPHWLGLLLDPTSDGYGVYGYITATNIKLMVITKDVQPSNKVAIKLIQTFLKEAHQHYIAYLLNPFCDTRGGSIISKQFDVRIANSIAKMQQQPTMMVD
jgi:hypothetical protein